MSILCSAKLVEYRLWKRCRSLSPSKKKPTLVEHQHYLRLDLDVISKCTICNNATKLQDSVLWGPMPFDLADIGAISNLWTNSWSSPYSSWFSCMQVSLTVGVVWFKCIGAAKKETTSWLDPNATKDGSNPIQNKYTTDSRAGDYHPINTGFAQLVGNPRYHLITKELITWHATLSTCVGLYILQDFVAFLFPDCGLLLPTCVRLPLESQLPTT